MTSALSTFAMITMFSIASASSAASSESSGLQTSGLPSCETKCESYCEGRLYSGGALTPICISYCEAEVNLACESESDKLQK